MAYEVPDLPYDYDALEPHIDEETMRIHHDKHHQAYVDKANAALEGTEWADKDVDEVLQNLDSLPADKQGPVRNNAGGHSNHTFFWQIMSPDGGGEPSGDLASRSTRRSARSIRSRRSSRTPGSASSAPAGRGSCTTAPASVVASTPNQDSPVSDGQTPLLGCRRLGARLLPEVPEQAPRLPGRVLERRQLGRGRPPVRGRELDGGSLRPPRDGLG